MASSSASERMRLSSAAQWRTPECRVPIGTEENSERAPTPPHGTTRLWIPAKRTRFTRFTVQGSLIPFAQTEAEREPARGPRLSLEARYTSRDASAARLAEAVDRLVANRLLLAGDADRLAIAAHEPWDVYGEL